jgi:hypothetical protein
MGEHILRTQSPPEFVLGGGSENFCHPNHFSEKILVCIIICTHFSRSNIVGGYMKGVN